MWFPAALIMGVNGYLQGDSSMVFRAFALLAYGALFISTIDNWLKPKLISDSARIHPVLVILGVFGGIAVFGFVGMVVGPLILSLFAVFVEIAKKEGVI
ncbi:AI-2E family transporter [Candidatus Woesearchaeota archaeon]|nr:AI-2E family transporter [Candidatus Woesearchaeota archaeon]